MKKINELIAKLRTWANKSIARSLFLVLCYWGAYFVFLLRTANYFSATIGEVGGAVASVILLGIGLLTFFKVFVDE